MQQNNQKKSQQINTFDPVFPIQFNAQQNIYFLTENSFANKLVELSIGNKVQNLQNSKFTWYLHPEEALYLISVWPYNQEQQMKYRQSLILKIYKNSKSQDIEMIHFYLNLRKRNKFCKRIDRFFSKSIKVQENEPKESKYFSKSEEIQKLIQNFKIFKVYQTHEDYKNDQNFNFYLLVQTKQKISSILFNPDLQKIKQFFKISTLNLCIIQNNDFIITQLNSF